MAIGIYSFHIAYCKLKVYSNKSVVLTVIEFQIEYQCGGVGKLLLVIIVSIQRGQI